MATQDAPAYRSEYETAQHILSNFDSLLGEEPEAEAKPKPTETEDENPQETEQAISDAESEDEEVNAAAGDAESSDDDDEESVDFNLDNLARHLGVEVDDLYDLELPIKVNGEQSQAQLRELVKNYQLESAINQKSMKLSEELKQTESEREQIRKERELYQQQLSPFLQQLTQLVNEDEQVDWEKLSQEDPQKYLQEKAKADARKDAQSKLFQQHQQMQSIQLQEHLAREHARLNDLIPEWKDDSVKKSEVAELHDYMKTNGFTDEDIQSISYGKADWIATIRKAWQFDKASTNIESKKKVKSAPKLKVRPGAARSKKEDRESASRVKLTKLRKTGKVDDAARAIYDMI